jgi:hypothetical protein
MNKEKASDDGKKGQVRELDGEKAKKKKRIRMS